MDPIPLKTTDDCPRSGRAAQIRKKFVKPPVQSIECSENIGEGNSKSGKQHNALQQEAVIATQ